MAKTKINPKDMAAAMNSVIQGNPGFRGNQKQMQELFKEHSINVTTFWPWLKNAFAPVGSVQGRTIYGFKLDENGHPQPIHYKFVEKALQDRREYVSVHKVAPSQETDKETSKEAECIAYLKELGYKIFKPITDYKEV